VEMGGKEEVQTCSRDENEGCHPDAVYGISTLSTPQSDVCDGNLAVTASELNVIWPISGVLSGGFRLMKWKSCGVSNMI